VLVCKLAHVNKNVQFKSEDLNSEGEPRLSDFETFEKRASSRDSGLEDKDYISDIHLSCVTVTHRFNL
jgi:hypothetical protein